MSIVFHVVLVVAAIYAPKLPMFQASAEEQRRADARRAQLQQPPENRTFVFVRPKVDLEAPKPPPRAEASDKNRIARAPQVSPTPANPLPYSRGTTTSRTEESPQEIARGVPNEPPSADPASAASTVEPARPLPQGETGYTRPRETGRPAGGSPLGNALRNLQRYVQEGNFDNPQGGAQQPGAAIQFDTKGVEFGPWIRRFVAQVKRNWFVPNAAMLLRGRVVLQFNIHKDGRITDLVIVGPSNVESFNTAAFNAILTSNPTEPLPPEYPTDKALFTVTFYYNEEPPAY